MESVLTKSQKKELVKHFKENGRDYVIKATIRYDDQCGNGYNDFAITAEVWTKRQYEANEMGSDKADCESCGCLHDEVSKHFPELRKFIKWHLTSSKEPMYYLENTMYHAQQGKLDYARSSAIWPEATLEQLKDKDALLARLPALMVEFRKGMEELGFTF